MSSDPHAPTPAGPDPDEPTEIRSPDDAFAPAAEEAATAAEPSPAVAPTAATSEHPAGTAVPASDWLAARDEPTASQLGTPAPGDGAAAPFATPPSMSPPGTPEPTPLEQAQALTERPEVRVGLAFVGGALATFVLKGFGR